MCYSRCVTGLGDTVLYPSHHEEGCCCVTVPALSRASTNTAGDKGGSKGWDRQEVHFALLMILAWKLQAVHFIGVSNRRSTCPDTNMERELQLRSAPQLGSLKIMRNLSSGQTAVPAAPAAGLGCNAVRCSSWEK